LKIGILGGTFDPMHRGHTYLARAVLKVFSLDRVLLMVSYLAHHKGKQKVTSPFHRYAMVVLNLSEEENLYASLWHRNTSALHLSLSPTPILFHSRE